MRSTDCNNTRLTLLKALLSAMSETVSKQQRPQHWTMLIILFVIIRSYGAEMQCDTDVFLSQKELAMYFNSTDISSLLPPVYIIQDCASKVRNGGRLVYTGTNETLPYLPPSADSINISWRTNDTEANYSISAFDTSIIDAFLSVELSIPREGTVADYPEGFSVTFPCLEDAQIIGVLSFNINITTSSVGIVEVEEIMLKKDCRDSKRSSESTSITPLDMSNEEEEGSGMGFTLLPSLSSLPSSPNPPSPSISAVSLSPRLSSSLLVSSLPSSPNPPSPSISAVSLSPSLSSSLLVSSLPSSPNPPSPSISAVSLSPSLSSSLLVSLSLSSAISTDTLSSSVPPSRSPNLSSSRSPSSSSPSTPPSESPRPTFSEGGFPLMFYVIVFSPVVGFLVLLICIVICCLCCIKCAKKKDRPALTAGFFDNPDEIIHRMYDEAFEFEKEDEYKKEAIPVSLWMTLPWGHKSILPLHTQKMLKMLNIDRRSLSISNTFLRAENGCLNHGLLLVDCMNPLNAMNQGVMLKIMTGLDDGGYRDDILRFIDQASLMRGLEHSNILPVLGMSLEDNCVPIVIYPIMEYGNLHSFIELCRVSPESCPLNPFGVEFKTNFALQISLAMKFLCEKGIIHHDLALRNCWLDTNYQVKLSDGALAQEFHPESYSKIKGALRPVKWSALETLQEGLLTTQSNVWSYGIVLWEVFSMAQPPYPDVPNGSIISHLMMDERLPQPKDCPADVYQLMRDCWERRAEKRPNPASIHSSLRSLSAKLPPLVYPAVCVAPVPTHFSPRTTEPTYTTFFSEAQDTVPVTMERYSFSSANDPQSTRHSGASGLNEGVIKRHSGTKKRSSGHLSSSSVGRGGDHISLSFSILSATDDMGSSSSDSDNEGGGSFPSTLRSTKSTTTGTMTTGTMTTDIPQLVSESLATLQPASPLGTMPTFDMQNISPDVVSKTSTIDDSVSARSSMVLATTAHSVSGTDRSSFYSTGIDSISTTFSTPLPNSIQTNHVPSIELKTFGVNDDNQLYKSRPVDTSSASPVVGKSTDSGIRSDEDTSSSDGHLASTTAAPPPPHSDTTVPLRLNPISSNTSTGTCTSTPRDSSHASRTSFGLGLSDMSSELMAAVFDQFGTSSFKS